MLELNQKRTNGNSGGKISPGSQQPRRLLLALTLLLVALVGLLIKDRQFWFGSEQAVIDADITEQESAPQASATPAQPARGTTARRKQVLPTNVSTESTPAVSPIVATKRTVLPPLDLDVVGGDASHKSHPGNKYETIELKGTTNAAEREPLTTVAAAIQPPQAQFNAYPVLGPHTNVQGSVVLQAIINADGAVESLRVLSGPSILASAAQQAVREWRFKPVLQNGQPVETTATITVNFTIKVNDNSATKSS